MYRIIQQNNKDLNNLSINAAAFSRVSVSGLLGIPRAVEEEVALAAVAVELLVAELAEAEELSLRLPQKPPRGGQRDGRRERLRQARRRA